MPPSRRRRLDAAAAVALTVLVAVTALVVHLRSDARATSLTTGPDIAAPAPMADPPAALDEVWSLPTDPRFPGVASPYGTVVTATGHAVTGHDAVTGEQRWSYERSNLALCALGTGDTRPDTLTASGAVRGILTGYSKGDTCSEITLLNPITGERTDQRTGATAADSTLVFGGPYGGLVSDDLIELWRYDLVRTIQYGDQPAPTKPNTKHLGCRFDDVAVTTQQFATIEHCAAGVGAEAGAADAADAGAAVTGAADGTTAAGAGDGPDAGDSAQLVLNFADPNAAPDGKTKNWDAFNHDPRATVDLGTPDARVLSLTADTVAVLVAVPEPAVVVYDAVGAELSRTPVPVSAADIAASVRSHRVTPVTVSAGARYAWVGTSLIAIDSDDLSVRWTMGAVLGTPAVVGARLLVPVADGLAVVDATAGTVGTTLPVDRTGYDGEVTVRAVGNTVVESRGAAVVGLRDPAAPATDPPTTSGAPRPTSVSPIPAGTPSAEPAADTPTVDP